MTLLTCLHITRLAENQVTQLITRQQTPETLPSVALLWKSFPFTVLVAGRVSPLRLVLISSTLHPAGTIQTDQSRLGLVVIRDTITQSSDLSVELSHLSSQVSSQSKL